MSSDSNNNNTNVKPKDITVKEVVEAFFRDEYLRPVQCETRGHTDVYTSDVMIHVTFEHHKRRDGKDGLVVILSPYAFERLEFWDMVSARQKWMFLYEHVCQVPNLYSLQVEMNQTGLTLHHINAFAFAWNHQVGNPLNDVVIDHQRKGSDGKPLVVLRRWLKGDVMENKLPVGPTINQGASGCVVATVDEKPCVLFVREASRPKYWDLPGGSCNVGEFAEDAVMREVLEETGLDVKSMISENSASMSMIGKVQWLNNPIVPAENFQFAIRIGDDVSKDRLQLKVDPSEIVEAKWVPIYGIAIDRQDQNVPRYGEFEISKIAMKALDVIVYERNTRESYRYRERPPLKRDVEGDGFVLVLENSYMRMYTC